MIKYYAFWIPITQKSDLPILCEKLPEKKLQDNETYPAVFIKGEIKRDTYNIHLKYRQESEKQYQELIFIKEKITLEGICFYRLELPDTNRDFLCEELSQNLHKAIYHYFKEFFHQHRFHHHTVDSLLPTYSSDEVIDWEYLDLRKEFLSKIIDFYQLKFDGFFEMWSRNFDKASTEISKNKDVLKNIELLSKTIQTAQNVFGESHFCNFLIKNFSIEIPKKNKKKIKEVLQELQELYKTIVFWHEFYISKISLLYGKKSLAWGVFGSVFSILSIGLTLFLEYHSDFETNMERHINKQDSIIYSQQKLIENNLQTIKQEQQNIREKQDTIIQLLNKKQKTIQQKKK